jgi:hypothetical protein
MKLTRELAIEIAQRHEDLNWQIEHVELDEIFDETNDINICDSCIDIVMTFDDIETSYRITYSRTPKNCNLNFIPGNYDSKKLGIEETISKNDFRKEFANVEDEILFDNEIYSINEITNFATYGKFEL